MFRTGKGKNWILILKLGFFLTQPDYFVLVVDFGVATQKLLEVKQI